MLSRPFDIDGSTRWAKIGNQIFTPWTCRLHYKVYYLRFCGLFLLNFVGLEHDLALRVIRSKQCRDCCDDSITRKPVIRACHCFKLCRVQFDDFITVMQCHLVNTNDEHVMRFDSSQLDDLLIYKSQRSLNVTWDRIHVDFVSIDKDRHCWSKVFSMFVIVLSNGHT